MARRWSLCARHEGTGTTMSSAHGTTVIEAGGVGRGYWKELWRHRELLYFLAWRDVIVRYKQTTIGVAWAFIKPFVTMVIFSIVFGKLANLPSGNVPYPVLVFAALLPWQLFSGAFADMGASLVTNAGVVSKIYFPRIIIPLSVIAVALLDFALGALIYIGLMLWYGVYPDWRVTTLPLFMALGILAILGPGLLIAALTVKYRDTRYVIPFIVQIGLYASPVGFSSSLIPEHYRLLYSLNPMVGVIDGFRWALLQGGDGLFLPGVAISLVLSVLMLIAGLRFFRRSEQTFADVI
jgi:lipopolysaccharide transport system permease protein